MQTRVKEPVHPQHTETGISLKTEQWVRIFIWASLCVLNEAQWMFDPEVWDLAWVPAESWAHTSKTCSLLSPGLNTHWTSSGVRLQLTRSQYEEWINGETQQSPLFMCSEITLKGTDSHKPRHHFYWINNLEFSTLTQRITRNIISSHLLAIGSKRLHINTSVDSIELDYNEISIWYLVHVSSAVKLIY